MTGKSSNSNKWKCLISILNKSKNSNSDILLKPIVDEDVNVSTPERYNIYFANVVNL